MRCSENVWDAIDNVEQGVQIKASRRNENTIIVVIDFDSSILIFQCSHDKDYRRLQTWNLYSRAKTGGWRRVSRPPRVILGGGASPPPKIFQFFSPFKPWFSWRNYLVPTSRLNQGWQKPGFKKKNPNPAGFLGFFFGFLGNFFF